MGYGFQVEWWASTKKSLFLGPQNQGPPHNGRVNESVWRRGGLLGPQNDASFEGSEYLGETKTSFFGGSLDIHLWCEKWSDVPVVLPIRRKKHPSPVFPGTLSILIPCTKSIFKVIYASWFFGISSMNRIITWKFSRPAKQHLEQHKVAPFLPTKTAVLGEGA